MNFKKVPLVRYMLQLVSFLSFIVFFAGLSYPLGLENQGLQWFTRLDPWLLLSELRWQQEVPTWTWLPLLTLVSTVLWGRVFCSWLCPFGTLLAFTDKFGRSVFKKLSLIRSKVLHSVQPVRAYWLIFLVVVFVFGSNWVLFLTPFALFSHEVMRIIMGHIPWMLIVIMVSTLLFSRFWCSVLCPTGVLLSLVARLNFFRYELVGNCVHCEKCTRICSVGTASSYTGTGKEGCLGCGDCQRVCPTQAIKWQRSSWRARKDKFVLTDDITVKKHHQSRRQFLKVTFTVASAVVLWKKIVWAAEKALRPPGALPELEFTAVCNRCGRCVKVCPSGALSPMPIDSGLRNFETPHIIPRKKRCDLCLACQTVCPTGAIREVPLEKVRMGKAMIEKPSCIAWNEGKLCYICGEQCPVLAITADEHHRPSVLSDKCVGCGACENACPVEGEAAIHIFPN